MLSTAVDTGCAYRGSERSDSMVFAHGKDNVTMAVWLAVRSLQRTQLKINFTDLIGVSRRRQYAYITRYVLTDSVSSKLALNFQH
jgi:hypothetical protein